MNTSLEYKYLPCTSGKTVAPVIVMFHGRGTDENDLLGLAPYFDAQFHLFSLRAPFPFEFGGYMWCTIEEDGSIDYSQLRDSRARVEQFFTELQRNPNVDSRNIFLYGFSLGALMVLDVALHSQQPIAGVVAHSGFYGEENPTNITVRTSYPKVFLAHGVYDPVVPIALGRETYKLLTLKNIQVEYREYPIEHSISEESLNDSIQWIQRNIVQ